MRTAAEIEANLTRLRTQFDAVAEKEPPDRAAGRLKPAALQQVTRSMDADLRRYCDLRDRIASEEYALRSARRREEIAAARGSGWTQDDVVIGAQVRTRFYGWLTVEKVNAKSVVVEVVGRMSRDRIVEVRLARPSVPVPTPAGGEDR